MANEIETPSFGNFSIEHTMEMGSAELLNDLLSPETSTTSPEDIEKIVKEIPSNKEEKKKEEEQKEEIKKPSIEDFLANPEETSQEEKEEATETSTEETNEAPSEDENRFTALSNDLFKLGVFNKEDEEGDVTIKSPEEFLERFQNEKKKGAIEIVNNFISQFGEDYQEAFQAIFVKGASPKEYFSTYNNIADFSSLDMTKEDNQIAVIKQALHDQGFEAEDIDTEVERIKNYGDLESVATKHHKVLAKKEVAKLQQIEQKASEELQQKANIRQQYITNVQSIIQSKLKEKEFDGIPINPKIASEVQDFLLVDKYKTPTGETLTDFDRAILEMKRPENHETKVKLALLLKILEKDPTLSTIQKSGVTKKSNDLFSSVARQKTPAVNTNKSTTSTSWFS